MVASLIGFHLGNSTAFSAGHPLPNTTGIVAMGGGDYMLDQNNQVWQFPQADGIWIRDVPLDPPVQLSEIKFWNANSILTHNNVAWRARGGGWDNVGSWPGTPTGIPEQEPVTWGAIKALYGQDEDD
jgi:hypothetical protein